MATLNAVTTNGVYEEESNSCRKREPTLSSNKKVYVDLCEVCEKLLSKYKCPNCGIISCSLDCVRQHKEDSGCNGKRNKTAFVHLKQFTDSHLMSDYCFLEDVDRCVNSGARMRGQVTGASMPCRRKVQELKAEAKRRGIRFFFLSHGMEKREQNVSFFDKSKRKIFWKIKLIFAESETEFAEENVCEDDTLRALLTKYLHPVDSSPWLRYKLMQYVSPPTEDMFSKVEVLLKAERLKGKETRYHKMDPSKSISGNLRHKTIVEFPELHIVLQSNMHKFSIMGSGTHKKRGKGGWKEKRHQNSRPQELEESKSFVECQTEVGRSGQSLCNEDPNRGLNSEDCQANPIANTDISTAIPRELSISEEKTSSLLVPYSDSETEEGEICSD